MTDKPRRWFQIHLSTAIILSLVWGVLLPHNLTPRPWFYDGHKHVVLIYHRGWPMCMNRGNANWHCNILWAPDTDADSFGTSLDFKESSPPPVYQGEWYISAIIVNVLTLLAISFALATCLEAVFRRKEAQP